VKPPTKAYTEGAKRKGLSYWRVNQTLNDILTAVGVNQLPVVFGFAVYESFESEKVSKKGIVPMPMPGEQMLGGHAVAIVGYDMAKRVFIVRNSWGSKWGDRGYFYMPFDYVLDPDLACDFWVLQKVEGL
jgi:C1A family cysteine protease